ncbi:MAG: cytochrome c [Burkholderiales bacterium]|nr:cytochrome c [Burkholderiales bacterium]
MKSKRIAVVVSAALLAGIAAEALAQQKPENYVRFRKANQQVVAFHMRELAPIVKSAKPDIAEATRVANVVATLAPVFAHGFPAGTGDGDTRARPEIWSQPDKFKQAMDRYIGEANKMLEVARSGNADGMRTQFGTLSKACDSCHDDFRRK